MGQESTILIRPKALIRAFGGFANSIRPFLKYYLGLKPACLACIRRIPVRAVCISEPTRSTTNLVVANQPRPEPANVKGVAPSHPVLFSEGSVVQDRYA